MDKRQREINRYVEGLRRLAAEGGYVNISVETLQMTMREYVRRFNPPKQPGKVRIDLKTTNPENPFADNAFPKLHRCDRCRHYKPQAELAVAGPISFVCKTCNGENVVPLFSRQKK